MSETDDRHQETESEAIPQGNLTESFLRISSNLGLIETLEAVAQETRRLVASSYAVVNVFGNLSGATGLFTDGISSVEFAQSLPELLERESVSESEEEYASSTSGGQPQLPENMLRASLIVEGKHVGAIYVGDKQGGGAFTAEDAENLQQFEPYAAIAVTNASLFRNEQETKVELESLIGSAPVGVFVFSVATGNLTLVNNEGIRLARGVVGRGSSFEQFAEFMPLRLAEGREVGIDAHPMTQAVAAGNSIAGEQFIVEYPDGQSVTTLIGASPILSSNGDVSSVAVFFQDGALLAGRELLPVDLIDAVNNALRRPLTTMKGSTATALGAVFPPGPTEARLLFKILDDQLNSVRRMMNDLVDMGKIKSGTLALNLQPASVAEAIEEAHGVLQGSGSKIALELEIHGDLPAVSADRDRLVQVLVYLSLSAFPNVEGTLTLKLTVVREESHVRVALAHEGEKAVNEELSRLLSWSTFPEFRNSEQEIEQADLALPICVGVVVAHGGQIWVESEETDSRTIINFTLPIASDNDDEIDLGTRESDELEPTEPATVLVAGLRRQVVLHVRDTLAGAGYQAVAADNSDEAEQAAIVDRPDIVLLDIALPQIEGLGLVRRLRELLDCPIIFMSAQTGDQDIARAFEMGAYDFISRPLSPAELVGRVNAAIHNRAAIRSGQINSYVLADLRISYTERRVTVGGQPTRLTATEYRLLCELSLNAGRVLTNGQLLRRVWGPQATNDTRILRTFIKNLRRKLGDDAQHPTYIFTEPRVGYRMERPSRTIPESEGID